MLNGMLYVIILSFTRTTQMHFCNFAMDFSFLAVSISDMIQSLVDDDTLCGKGMNVVLNISSII